MSLRLTGELSPGDRKILQAALAAGHAFETSFSAAHADKFRSALESCRAAESPLLGKLAELAPKVSLELGPKHLMTLLVPIERLAGRSARDEEFLYFETDGGKSQFSTSDEATNLGQRIVLCENLRSAFNVGSVYRTAETFGGNEVWLAGYSPDPQKTAMGADALVRGKRFERTRDAIREAKDRGFKIVALENAPGAIPLDEFTWPEKTVLVLGNERFGVDSHTLAECDSVVRISTMGQKNSLNVGIAFGVAAAAWRSRRIREASHEVLRPIGYVRGGFENPQVAPRQGAYLTERGDEAASIELEARFDGRPSNFEQALKDLENFERAWIVFGFDQSEGWNPQVRPPRGDGIKRGLFATRSPHRPNRLGISSVRIHSVEGRTVAITEHDFLDGTPVFDIKPYVPGADAFPNAKAGWLDGVAVTEFSLLESKDFQTKVEWLESNNERRLRPFVSEQLRFQPFDQDRKRVDLATVAGGLNTVAFRTWRLDFREISERALELVNLRSGYTDTDLNDKIDVYGDKELHRAFKKEFHE